MERTTKEISLTDIERRIQYENNLSEEEAADIVYRMITETTYLEYDEVTMLAEVCAERCLRVLLMYWTEVGIPSLEAYNDLKHRKFEYTESLEEI
jgi:hypothetical protein